MSVDGNPDTSGLYPDQEPEVASDIEMVISMAPHLSKVVVYEGGFIEGVELLGDNANDVLNVMANDTNNTIKQFTCSWVFYGDVNSDQIFTQFVAQGQSFFQASGDGDAWVGSIHSPDDDPNVITVGGTTLTMTGAGVSYASETVWNLGYDSQGGWPVTDNGYLGSGGGISTTYAIPVWQQGVDMSHNGGSSTMRNVPDVAMVAGNIFIAANSNSYYNNWSGTSAAAPLWAGFTALVNQQAAINGQANVGFLNPALYRIGNRPPISVSPFHDIADGSNNGNSQNVFYAVPGYDLCTGWGTPNGTNLINALLATPPTIYNNQPQSQSATVGSTVIFSVGVGGTPPFSYQWFWNDSAHPLHDGGNISGSLTSTLTIKNVQTTNAGSYFVVVSNPANSVTSGNAALTVYVTAPTSTTITFDDLSTPTVSGEFHYGSFSVYDGLNWNNFGVLNGVLATNTGYYAGVVSQSNVVANSSGTPAYFYSASAFDLISANLTAAWNDNLQVEVLGYTGSTATYSNIYTLSATNPTLITFNYLGVTEVYFASSGGTKHTAYTAGSGTHFVMDNVVVTTNLSVAASPQIVTQPTNQANLLGSKVTFTVSAMGAAPMSYQWLKNGSTLLNGGNISGSTTSALTVSNISNADIAIYSVVVSNPYGSMVSTGAVLAIYVLAPSSLITFDDLATPENDTVSGVFEGDEGAIPANYYNLQWNNLRVYNGIGATPSGYQAGAVSLSNVIFNVQANPGSITSGAPFNFISAYLTAAWNDNLQVKVLGYVGSTVTYSNTCILSATAPTLFNFNYLGVNEVYFTSSGWTHHSGYFGNGTHFAMDNVTIATNLPVSFLPTVQTLTKIGNAFLFSWVAVAGQTYQVQYKTNLTQTVWNNLGGPVTAFGGTMTASDSITNSQRYYRIVLMP